MLLISCDAASNPSMYDEHFGERIMLDPEIIAILQASADYLESKGTENRRISQAAAELVQGTASGSAVLADFPDVEYGMPRSVIPEDLANKANQDSALDDLLDEPAAQHDEPVHSKPPEVPPAPQQTRSGRIRRDPSELLDSEPLAGADGLNQIRGYLHQPHARTWMFVGDQTTAWLRYHGEPGYAELFRHRIRWELRRFPDLIVNAGIRNATLDNMIKIVQQGLLQCRADCVFIMPGLIDQTQASQHPFTYSEKLRQLIGLIQSLDVIPILQTPPVPRLSTNETPSALWSQADLIREVAIVEGVGLIDHAEFWQEQSRETWWTTQGLEVSQEGQRALAMLFFSELDLYDRSSQLCSKLQETWNQSVETNSTNSLSVHS